jgi:transcriptional regulator with XRE-family HTH domain
MASPSDDDLSTADPDANDPILVTFGARLRELRHAAGMTQEDLAFASTLHWTYVSQIERGLRNLTYKKVLQLARALEMPPELLLAGIR